MIVGIDLGTTNSLIAWVDDGRARIIPNGRGQMLTPSVVAIDRDGTALVGETARNRAAVVPHATVLRVKRRMGERTTLPIGDASESPEEISSRILTALRRQARDHLGSDVRSAVITVPAHFDDRQRQATFEAALLAGFDRVRLLNEPTAAALPYATRERDRERILVFDFGGGTLDVTALLRERSEFVVRATCGDGELGGADIDRVLLDRIARDLEAQTGIDPLDDVQGRAALEQLAEQCKIELSEAMSATVALPFFGGGASHPEVTITRGELESAIEPFVARAIALVEQAVVEAGYRSGFDTLVLAGGSSRLPVIRQELERRYPVRIASRINPDEVVAAGAALFGATLDERMDFTLRDVLSGTLAVELADGTSVPLMQRNQSVPARHTRLFATEEDGQREAEIHLLQGDHRDARRNRSLGKFVLRDLADADDRRPRIAVTVDVSDDGLVRVLARDTTGSQEAHMQVRSRPGSIRRDIGGDPSAYGASLVRRLGRLSQRVDAELASEVRDVIALAESSAPVGLAEDLIALLESLVDECVSSVTPISRRRAAAAAGGRDGGA